MIKMNKLEYLKEYLTSYVIIIIKIKANINGNNIMKINKNELDYIKEIINKRDNFKGTVVIYNNHLMITTDTDTSLLYDMKSLYPLKIPPYYVVYNYDIAKKRLSDISYIKKRLKSLFHLHNQTDVIYDILVSNGDILVNKEAIINQLITFYSKKNICDMLYSSLMNHFKNKRIDFEIDYNDFEIAFKDIPYNIPFKPKMTKSKMISIMFDYLSNKVISNNTILNLSIIKVFQNVDKSIVDNRYLTPLVIYDLIKDMIYDETHNNNDFISSREYIKYKTNANQKYTYIINHLILDNIYDVKDEVIKKQKRNTGKVSKTKSTNKVTLKDKIDYLNINIEFYDKNILKISVLNETFVLFKNTPTNVFSFIFIYNQNNKVDISENSESEIYTIDSVKKILKPIQKRSPKTRKPSKVNVEIVDTLDFKKSDISSISILSL